jgi:hypothetical protein
MRIWSLQIFLGSLQISKSSLQIFLRSLQISEGSLQIFKGSLRTDEFSRESDGQRAGQILDQPRPNQSQVQKVQKVHHVFSARARENRVAAFRITEEPLTPAAASKIAGFS